VDVAARRQALEAAYDGASFEELAELYFRLFETTEEIRQRELAALHDSHINAEEWLYQMGQVVPMEELASEGALAIDIGCGSGGLAIGLAQRGFRVLGIDVDLERLILARKHAESRGVSLTLAAGESERLPAAPEAGALVTCIEVLEHVSDQPRTLGGLRRVIRPGGYLYLTTRNRYSLGREPHVRLWALGYLPRRWTDRYVRWRLGVPYTGKRNPSFVELRRLFRRGFGGSWRVVREKRRTYTVQGRLAEWASRIRPLRWLVTLIGAGFHVVAWRR
jgi:2-polyprenyl-3-methyl-5-hydroxy-6-metoxy-1,4-benzoquinol methylase